MPLHQSIKMNYPCEMINITPVNPLISKCQIKVCYVSDKPNRNGSVITKEVARDMANSLPGSPIVGYFNENSGDFEEHNRAISISQGEFKITDTTRPYGFVDLGAKCWFQKFQEGMIEREYLMTEGYLWTGQYPECERVITKGNNQSMELDEKNINAHWAKDENGDPQFFIINEAIISKLCILGEDYEPCFEGAQITKVQFSFDDGFKEKLFSMMNELKELLNEGGVSMNKDNLNSEGVITEDQSNFAAKPEEEKKDEKKDNEEEICPKCGKPVSECECEKEDEEDKKKFAVTKEDEKEEKICPKCGKPISECECEKDDEEDKKKKFAISKPEEEDKDDEDKCPECGKPKDECTCEDEKKKEDKKEKYNLNEIPEYVELSENYNTLQSQYSALETEVSSLREFKIAAERKGKQAMIDGFYMLSEEDKKDVVDNIDNYSLEDIEAKLSVICVRNKVSFDLDNNKKDEKEVVTYSINSDLEDGNVPAIVKAMRDVAKNM